MALAEAALEDAVRAVQIARDAAGFAAIRDADCAAVLWQRAAPDKLTDWLDGLPVEQLPKARLVVRAGDVRRAVDEVCDAFAALLGASHVRLRLDVVTANMCPKFHIDAVPARLICTYRGTGTQYGLSRGGADPDRVVTVPTGAAIVLRGTEWPDAPLPDLRHRSPPIAGTGETRLLLVVDPAAEVDDAGVRSYEAPLARPMH